MLLLAYMWGWHGLLGHGVFFLREACKHKNEQGDRQACALEYIIFYTLQYFVQEAVGSRIGSAHHMIFLLAVEQSDVHIARIGNLYTLCGSCRLAPGLSTETTV